MAVPKSAGWILVLLLQGEGRVRYNKPVTGRTRLIRELFLLKMAYGLKDIEYRFIPYWYGPIKDPRTGRSITTHVMNQDFVAWTGQGEVADRTQEHLGYSNHQADDASAAFDQAKDMSLRQNAENLLNQVNAALRRFDNGTYGLCVECNQPIDTARLKAIPYAELCMDCQRKRER